MIAQIVSMLAVVVFSLAAVLVGIAVGQAVSDEIQHRRDAQP